VKEGGWMDRLLLLPMRRPLPTILVLALATALAAWSWSRVRLQPDVSRLLPGAHPQVAVAELLDDRARSSRLLWLLLRGSEIEARLPGLQAALRASPLVAEVAVTRAELLGAAGAGASQPSPWLLPDRELARLGAMLGESGVAAAIEGLRADLADDPLAARELAVRDPLGLRWTWAECDLAAQLGLRPGSNFATFGDGGCALVRLRGSADAYDVDYALELLAHVERALAGVDHELFGGYAVARADQARLRADFGTASAWSFVLIAAYLGLSMRGLRLPLLVQVPAALSIAWAVPLASACFGPLPAVAVAAVAVLLGLGVDFAIHFAARYREARLGSDHATAVRAVQRRIAPELSIDMATTAVTFLAVGFGQSGGLAAFGWLLAIGLAASVLLTLTALPLLLRWAGERVDPERSLLAGLADRWLGHRRARPVAWTALGAMAALAVAVGVRGVPLTGDGEALRPADDPVVTARARIESTLGFSTVPCLVLWPLADDASPLWAALHGARSAGQVRFWSGLGREDTAAGRQAVLAMRADAAGIGARLHSQFAAAGFEVGEFEPAFADVEAMLARDPEAEPEHTLPVRGAPHRVVTVWPAADFDAAAFAALRTQIEREAGAAALVHGTASVAEALAEVLRADLQRAIGWAVGLALLMVAVWLRSLRHGLLALLPSACGLVATAAWITATGQPLTMVSFVAIPFVLGIGVDEGVHLVGQFRHGAATTGATGVGVVRTSVGTALGFGALLTADSPALAQLGGVVAFGSLASMLAGLFVLAPLLARQAGR